MSIVAEASTPAIRPIPELVASIPQHPFRTYLVQHHLSWLTVAREAQVPCLTVWQIAHGAPISGAQAMRVRLAIHRLSGIAYTGPMCSKNGNVLTASSLSSTVSRKAVAL